MSNYSEDQLIEQPAIALFGTLGYQTLNAYHEDKQCNANRTGMLGRETTQEVVLIPRLRAALHRLNPGLSHQAIELAIEDLTHDRSILSLANANREVYQLLKHGVPVTLRNEKNEEISEIVRVIDWDVSANNDFLLVSQLWVSGDIYKRRADLVGFVNGLPLIFCEFKASHKQIEDAYNNNLRDYKNTIPQLFWYNALIILSNGSQSRIGSMTAPWEHFFEWKKIDSEDEEGAVSLETMLRGICEKTRLLDIVENFTLFSDAGGALVKILAKNHQYLGVNNALEAVHAIRKNQGRLGVFWHTQGSGKSLSMVFFSQKVQRKIPGNWTFVVVTDRDDLDNQVYKKFAEVGAVTELEEEVRADSGEHLKLLLRENHRTIFTLIQKFHTDKGQIYPRLSDRSDIIVMTDEAHRSQYDIFALNMRNALPNAAFIGFTGTPLMLGEERTREVFGEYVSIYNFRQSVEDGTTVALYYENRIPELQLANTDFNEEMERIIESAAIEEQQEKRLEREFAREYHLITIDDRLEKIAEDIVAHFMGRGQEGKAMVVSIDKATAVRMYDKVQHHWKAYHDRLSSQLATCTDHLERQQRVDTLKFMRTTKMAVIVSQEQNEIEKFKHPTANTYTALVDIFTVLAAKIRIVTQPPDISEAIGEIEKLVGSSIRTKDYIIRESPSYDTDRWIDLSKIDFDALRDRFEQAHKYTEVEKLLGALNSKLTCMVALNKSRTNYREKFQQLIDEYNAGSMNIEVLFEKLLAFAQELNVEEQRTIAEQLNEEELAVFDLLTRPGIELSQKELEEVKKVMRELLATLKQEKLVLDWRKKQEARAKVSLTVQDTFDKLPSRYTSELYTQKCAEVYQHIYDSYYGAGRSIYAAAS